MTHGLPCTVRLRLPAPWQSLPRLCLQTVAEKRDEGFFGFWTLGSTARLVMHECAVVRNSAVAQGRSSVGVHGVEFVYATRGGRVTGGAKNGERGSQSEEGMSVCLSVCLPIYLSIYLSICLHVYLSITIYRPPAPTKYLFS